MNVAALRRMLRDACQSGYADYSVYFYDQDGDGITIDQCYTDDDGDVCLESNEYDYNEYTAERLCQMLDGYNNGVYVYVYNDDIDQCFDIDEAKDWYIGDDDCLCIDTYYEEDE